MIVNILIFLIGLVIYAGYGWAGLAYLAAAVLLLTVVLQQNGTDFTVIQWSYN